MKNSINDHFKRESKIMIWLFIIPFIIGFIIMLIYPYFSHEIKIDSCLDSGGSFNYETCECDYKNSHKNKVNHQCK